MASSESPIKIETLEDARSALKRKNGSFEEWLDCARIFSQNRDWPRLEMSAEYAFNSLGNRNMGVANIREAATRYAAGSLSKVAAFEDLNKKSLETRAKLQSLKSQFPNSEPKQVQAIESVIEVLDEILLYLADGSPEALVGVASRLRKKLGRPDLGIATANRVLKVQSDSAAARTTRGAAWTDLGRYDKALLDFEFAEKNSRGRPYAIAGHTRLLICQGNFHEAYMVGAELLQSKLNRPNLYLLAAAAKGAGLNDEFSRLVGIADKLSGATHRAGRLILTRKSIEILILAKQFETASELIAQLRLFDNSKKPSELERLLNSELRIYKASTAKN